MGDRVWVSSIFDNIEIGFKQATHSKFFGHDWNPASFDIPVEPDEVYSALRRYRCGFALNREDFPEAEAVFDPGRFKKQREIFYVGPFLAVKGKFAKELAGIDLGNGGLIPFTIYAADRITPLQEEFFVLSIGNQKNTFISERSQNVRKLGVDKNSGHQFWAINGWFKDGEIAVSAEALAGPDLWIEETVNNKLFISNRCAEAIHRVGLSGAFELRECTVL